MSVQVILGIIASVLTIIIGLWRYNNRKNRYKREQAEKAKKDFENAQKTGNASDLLDSFNRLHK